MKRIDIYRVSDNIQGWGAVFPDNQYQAWIDSCIAKNCWGLPEREVKASDCSPEQLEAALSTRTDDEDVEWATLACEYRIEIVDITNDPSNPLWQALRAKRDDLLMRCDYTQLADAPGSPEDKAAWATYRQALRDLPANTADPSAPSWPVKPS